jgi:predicted nucleic acid-binding protein
VARTFGRGRRYVLDANALVGLFEDRGGIAEKVEQLLREALFRELPLLRSAVDWGEVFYTEWKYCGEVNAREAEARLRQLPVAVIPAELDRATRAAALKQKHNLDYADAFAAELAMERNAWLVTADPEFSKLGKTLKGEMDLHSGDGSENLEAVDGKLHASTGDGHITAHGRFDELELKTGDGHVEVRAASGSSLAAGWRLETGDGNVSLEVPAELAADVDLHTSDGHIDLDMPITTEGKIRQNEVRGKLNGGGSLLTIRTGDGSIHLRKG